MSQPVLLKSELRGPFGFSQSSLQDYADCARRFQLRYIEQLKWPAVESAPVLENERRQLQGQQFHRMVQQYLLGLPADKLARMASSEGLARWWENFTSNAPSFISGLDAHHIHPEITLSAPIGQHRLLAKYDLITVKDGRATIFDWKTYQKRPTDQNMAQRLQSRVYPALLATAGAHLNGGQPFAPDGLEMIYWYADFPPEAYKISYSTSRFKKDWGYLSKLIGEISAKQSFPLTDDEKKCAYCPYRSYCERGIAAGDGEALENEIGQLDIVLEQIQEIEF